MPPSPDGLEEEMNLTAGFRAMFPMPAGDRTMSAFFFAEILWIVTREGPWLVGITLAGVFALVFGMVIMGEDLPPQMFVALGLILAVLSIPSMVSALSEGRAPRVAALVAIA